MAASVKELTNLIKSELPSGYVEVPADKLQNIKGLNDPRIEYRAYYNAQTNNVILTVNGVPQPVESTSDASTFSPMTAPKTAMPASRKCIASRTQAS